MYLCCVTKQRVEVFTVPTPHQVNGRPVTGLTRSEVVSLLRQAQGDITLVVSRHKVVDEQDAEEVRPHQLKSCDLWRYSLELKEEFFISFFISSSSSLDSCAHSDLDNSWQDSAHI